MRRAYRFAIVHFALMGLLLIASAVVLHMEKTGTSADEVAAYYLGDPERFVRAKSVEGMMKTSVPHMAAYGLFIMVATHFFLFADARTKRTAIRLGTLLFFTGAANLLLPYLIAAGVEAAAPFKLASVALFCAASLWLLGLLIHIAVRGLTPTQ